MDEANTIHIYVLAGGDVPSKASTTNWAVYLCIRLLLIWAERLVDLDHTPRRCRSRRLALIGAVPIALGVVGGFTTRWTRLLCGQPSTVGRYACISSSSSNSFDSLDKLCLPGN